MTRVATVRRIGIFGGTFDPVHLGHLILAEQCREQGRLDEVWFVPAGNNPFKSDRFRTFDQRAEMVELAIAGHAAFKVNRVEKEMLEEFRRQHPAEPLPASYTYQTLAELHRRDPADELFLLIGSDSLEELPQWREPQQIARNAGLLVMLRAGHAPLSPEQIRASLALPAEIPLRIEYIASPPLIDIASRDLRRRVREGRSIRYLVPRAVEVYIKEKRLYSSEPASPP